MEAIDSTGCVGRLPGGSFFFVARCAGVEATRCGRVGGVGRYVTAGRAVNELSVVEFDVDEPWYEEKVF